MTGRPRLSFKVSDLDIPAIRMVVREGIYMNLSRPDLITAAHLMKRKGLLQGEVAARLNMSADAVAHLWGRDCPIDLDAVLRYHPTVIGPEIVRPPGFTRSLVRTM